MRVQIPVARVFKPALYPARFKGIHGGRGSGKSYFWAGEAIKALLSGKDVLCIREVQNSIADSVKRLIEARIEEFGLSQYFQITDKEIRCPRAGSVAIFRGMQNHNAANIKSLEGFDVAWWEEAQTATQMSLDLLIPTIRNAGSELWFSWNPQSETDPIDVMLRGEPPEDAVVIEANWHDNPWFPDELRADMERDRKRQPDKYLHVWEGRYQTLSEARVFKDWRIAEMTPPERAVWFYGLDFGMTDPTAGCRACVIGDHILYIDSEVYSPGVPMQGIPKLLEGLPDAQKWEMRCDSSRPETIDFLRRNGFPRARGAKKGRNSVADGIAFLQGMEIVVHPRCVNIARELGSYSYKTDKRTGAIVPEPEDENNHVIDSLRYACERLHRKGRLVPLPDEPTDKLKEPTDYRGWKDEDSDGWKVA